MIYIGHLIRTPTVFRRVPGTYRVTGRGFGHPRQKIWALWAKPGNTPATKGLVRPPYGLAKLEKERKKGIGFPLPALPFLLRIGIGKGGGRIWEDPK